MLNQRPYLTAALSGVGGVIKMVPEDFYVEEIPLYQPSGQGDHTYIWLEKVGIPTLKAIRLMAQKLGIKPKEIGYAGLKDAQATTRQMISIPKISPEGLENLSIPNLKILSAQPHRHKLRVGHLAGNKFIIRVREVSQEALPIIETILAQLQEQGVPNYFGEQRFGIRDNSHLLGKALLQRNEVEFLTEFLGRPHANELSATQKARAAFDQGDLEVSLKLLPYHLREERLVLHGLIKSGRTEAAIKAVDQRLRRLFVSAFQSELFNQLLADRLTTIHLLEVGDVAYIHQKGACFLVEDVEAEQPRADTLEISPSGPLFGSKYLAAQGRPGERERLVLQEANILPETFNLPGLRLRGIRRPYRIPLKDVALHWDEGIVLSFSLPPGAYATIVLREVMKNEIRQ